VIVIFAIQCENKQQQGELEWIIGNFSVPSNLFVVFSVWLTREGKAIFM